MQIVEKKVTELKAYEKNPRKNDKAVEPVAESIKQFGFKVPIIIDKDNIIPIGRREPSMPLKKTEGEGSISTVATRASNCSERFLTNFGQPAAPGMMSLSCDSIWQPLQTPRLNVSGRSKNALN